MTNLINIYCDESCHLENDRQRAMVLGAASCPAEIHKSLSRKIKVLKKNHGIPATREIKWTQVSPSNLAFYLALIDLFFDESQLGFRGVVVPDKTALDHDHFDQSHDDFYYKMWWLLLTRMVDDQHGFRVFIDIKDSHSAQKLTKLHEVLRNAHYDFDNKRIKSIEAVRSHDVLLIQLADVLTGALSHKFREVDGSDAKRAIIQRVRDRSGLTLTKSTPPGARKFNVFVWRAQETA